MSNKTIKHIWPVSLVMSIAIIGALAAFLVLSANPGATSAHEDDDHAAACAAMTAAQVAIHNGVVGALGGEPCPTGDGNGGTPGTDDPGNGTMMPAGAMLKSSSSTGSAGVKLTLTIELDQNLTGSSWVEIYLEDDYQEPGSIAKDDVVFEVQGINPAETDPPSNPTLNTTFAAATVEIDDGGDLSGEDNAVVISARIPDMRSGDETGYPLAGQTLLMVVSEAAGIKNPSEAGSHDTGFSIIGGTADRAGAAGTEDIGAGDNANADGKLLTKAKISLSADDGGRGKEVTISGSGFNNGTTAEAFVLVADDKPSSCMALVDNDDSESLGTAAVGSDDKFSIAFTVHQDEFDPGAVNWICAKDSESDGGNRYSSDVDGFEVKDSLSITPEAVASGEEVTLKPRDFMSSATLEYVYLGGTGEDDTLMCCGSDDPVQADGSDYVFDMPGGYSGSLRITVQYSDGAKASATITVEPSSLTLSLTEVAPNQSIVISGSGFSEKSYIKVSDITIDGQPLVVDESGTENMVVGGETVEVVKTTSTGEFTASVKVWSDSMTDNPALSDGTYKIKAEDVEGFSGSAEITILAPTLMVTPTAASPRDYIVISGTNWPVSTSDDDREVSINVDDRNRNAGVDSTGRFNYEYQLRSTIQIGKEHTITVTYDDGDGGGDIEEEITFIVPSSNVTIIPAAAAPGETIALEITGMPIIRLVEEVVIDGADRLRESYTTDREGNITVEGIVVPFADPGFYPVRITVGDDTAVIQLEILAEADVRGTASPLPEAVMDLGDSVVRIFHFNTSSKVWTFYDPRPEFDGLNTLTELAAGQPYWILVSEDVENVVLNGKTRNLTCVGGDCWNQLVW